MTFEDCVLHWSERKLISPFFFCYICFYSHIHTLMILSASSQKIKISYLMIFSLYICYFHFDFFMLKLNRQIVNTSNLCFLLVFCFTLVRDIFLCFYLQSRVDFFTHIIVEGIEKLITLITSMSI